jgi:hypothetical protein
LLKKKLRIDFSMKYILKYTDKFFISVSMNEKCFVEIPEKHRDFFFKNLKSSFDFLIENTNFLKLKNQSYLETYLKLMVDYSPAFLKKLDLELKTLNKNQLELFLEYIQYNFYFSKKANPLFDILRIKKGVLTKKILSKKEMYTCIETYSGFIRALKAGTVKIITLKIDGENKTLLVKSLPGNYKLKNFRDSKYGTFTLALDITNFNIYSFINVVDNKLLKNKIYNIRRGNSLKNFNLIEGFADYENVRKINKSLQERHILKKIDLILSQVEEIKKLLLNYKSEKISKRNDSFKKSVKKMLSDKKQEIL